jgi:hypothetical protein
MSATTSSVPANSRSPQPLLPRPGAASPAQRPRGPLATPGTAPPASASRQGRPRMDRPPARNFASRNGKPARAGGAAEHEILFQKFFKSVGPRTYAAQVKQAANGNHYLVLTEGKRDEKTGDVRKCRVFVYSEDFVEFFRLIKSAAEFVRDNPLPPEVKRKRDDYWAKKKVLPASASGATAGPPREVGARGVQ